MIWFNVFHCSFREGLEVTDDVSIVEHLKHPVYITEGSYTNIKVMRIIKHFIIVLKCGLPPTPTSSSSVDIWVLRIPCYQHIACFSWNIVLPLSCSESSDFRELTSRSQSLYDHAGYYPWWFVACGKNNKSCLCKAIMVISLPWPQPVVWS